MKKYLSLLVAAILPSMLASAQQWESLFNGQDLTGWKRVNGEAEFIVRDGCIVGTSKTNTPNTFLISEKNFGDFIFEFEFKVDSRLNSGVQFRSESRQSNGRVFGYQFEIDPATRAWTGGIYDEARRGWLFPLTWNDEARSALKRDEWNKGRIEAISNSIRTWVNDVLVSQVWDDMTPEGFFGLQVHDVGKDEKNSGQEVLFKNLRICTTDLEKYRTPANNDVHEVNAIPNTISPREAREGWRLLWDGKTTDGWRGAKSETFPTNGWIIKDGSLRVAKAEGKESANGGDIITDKKYKNFMLKVDFKIAEGATNSGIMYFVDPELWNKDAGSAIGVEYQILDDKANPDTNPNRTLGAAYDLVAPLKSKPFRAKEFNTAMIVVKDNHVEHWLNGIKIAEYERNTPHWNQLVAGSKFKNWPNFGNIAEGYILLQDHGDEVWFRNIKIKEL